MHRIETRGGLVVAGALVLLVAQPILATELYKCALRGGGHVYSSQPCPSGSREVWQREVAPDPIPDAATRRRLQDIAQWQQESRRETALRQSAGSGAGRRLTRSTAASEARRCERARERRDRIRDRDWMRMTYDRMVTLDQEVADACR